MICPILGCPNEGKHLFPMDPVRRQLWIKATKIELQKKSVWNLRKYSYLCSDHFEPSDFIMCHNGEKKLRKHSVPSIFPWTMTETITKIRPKISKTYSRQIHPTTYVEIFPLPNISNEKETDPLHIHQDIIHLSPEEPVPN